jgi:segregation and condensation protein A
MLAYNVETKQVQTEVFDGPLELLLYLIRREGGVDIRKIRITPIADAYLQHLTKIEKMNLDTAGNFIVMAATLCFLKSRELLPDLEMDSDEEEEDPRIIRERLAQRLIEYRRYQEASHRLQSRNKLDVEVFASVPIEAKESAQKVEAGVNIMGLLRIYQRLLQDDLAPPPVHTVKRATYSIREMSEWIIAQLAKEESFFELLSRLEHRSERIVFFLALLELARLEYIDFDQACHLGPIQITPRFTDLQLGKLSESFND